MLPITLISLLLAQAPDNVGPGPTDFYGGSSGRVAAVLCSPSDPNLYWIGTADGGVWKTTNGGTSWTPLTDSLPSTAIGALAMNPPGVPSALYAGSGESNYANHSRYGLGLYRSFDEGATWTVLGASTFSGRCFSRILVNPANFNTIYAATTATGGGPQRLGAKGHPLSGGPRGVFRSNDQGATWTQLLNGLPSVDATDLEFKPGNPLTMYATIGAPYGDAANGFYRTRDGGNTWTRLPGIPTDGGRISIAVCPATGRIYLAMCTISTGLGVGGSSASGGAVYVVARSDDEGDTWTTLTVDNYMSSQGFYNNLVVAHPTNQDIVLLGGVTVRRSTNAGASWTSHNTGHPDFHGWDVDASGRFVWGSDGGVWRTPSATNMTAVPLNTGLTTIQFYAGISSSPASDIVIMGGMQDNGTAMRSSTSLQWRHLTGGDGGWTRIQPLDPTLMFTCSQGLGNLNRSTNGGTSFAAVNPTGLSGRHAFFPPYLLDPVTPGRMLYASDRVHVSTNNGSAFTALSGDLTAGTPHAIRAMAMGTTDTQYVYVATTDSRVLSSTDGGSNFTLRLSDAHGWPRTTRELLVDPTDAQTVYLAGAQFGMPHVRRSTDAGATWTNLTGNLPDIPTQVIELDQRYPQARIYIGTDQGVWVSRNDGQTWSQYTTGLPNAPVIDLILEPSRGRMVIATQGRAIWFAPMYCPSDFNTDEVTDFFDYLDFVDAFSAGSLEADFNADGTLDFFDYLDFVDAFSAGC